jgi:ribonuclease R
MADKVGDEFEGYITGVSAFGLYLELVEHFVEGMVHVSTMADDYYRFVEKAHILRGEKTGKVYRLGDRVRVQVIRVDLERRQIDLGLSEILDSVRRTERPGAHRRGGPKPKQEERRAKRGRPGRRERAFKKAARGRKR